jgi:hypothetical protein
MGRGSKRQVIEYERVNPQKGITSLCETQLIINEFSYRENDMENNDYVYGIKSDKFESASGNSRSFFHGYRKFILHHTDEHFGISWNIMEEICHNNNGTLPYFLDMRDEDLFTFKMKIIYLTYWKMPFPFLVFYGMQTVNPSKQLIDSQVSEIEIKVSKLPMYFEILLLLRINL